MKIIKVFEDVPDVIMGSDETTMPTFVGVNFADVNDEVGGDLRDMDAVVETSAKQFVKKIMGVSASGWYEAVKREMEHPDWDE